MRLLLVRHGQAEDLRPGSEWGMRDELRPLTKVGEELLRKSARTIQPIIKRIDAVTSSDYVRAKQTAEIVARQFKIALSNPIADLQSGGDLECVIDKLGNFDPDSTVCAVGHAPSIAFLCSLLISRNTHANLRFGRGTMALVNFSAQPRIGMGSLVWLMNSEALSMQAGDAQSQPRQEC